MLLLLLAFSFVWCFYVQRKMLLLMGTKQFGEPPAKIVARLDAETDLRRLEALMIRLLHVKTWEELLGVNGTKRRPRGRR